MNTQLFINVSALIMAIGSILLAAVVTGLHFALPVKACDIVNTNQVALAHGSAKAPAYSFTDAPRSGMYLDSKGDLAFSVDGHDSLRIDTKGNVTIPGDLVVDGKLTAPNVGHSTTTTTTTTVAVDTSKFEPAIALGTTSQWWRGDKTWTEITSLGTQTVDLDMGTNNIVGVGQIAVARGTTSAPAYSFTNGTTTGLMLTEDSKLGVVTNGSTAVTIGTDGSVTLSGSLTVQGTLDGSVTLGTQTADVNMGTHNITAVSKISGGNGTQSVPTYGFTSQSGTGMFLNGSGQVSLVNGSQQLLLDSTVGVLIPGPLAMGPGVITVNDIAVDPTTLSNPTSGGLMYSNRGELYWRNSSGTVTKLSAEVGSIPDNNYFTFNDVVTQTDPTIQLLRSPVTNNITYVPPVYFEEATVAITFSGIYTTPVTVNVYFRRENDNITMIIPPVNGAMNADAIIKSDALPDRFKADMAYRIFVQTGYQKTDLSYETYNGAVHINGPTDADPFQIVIGTSETTAGYPNIFEQDHSGAGWTVNVAGTFFPISANYMAYYKSTTFAPYLIFAPS